MCKYCEGSYKPLNKFHEEKGNYCFTTKSLRITKNNNLSMYVENVSVGGYSYDDDDICEGLSEDYKTDKFKLSAKINFCPMCGRKLN